MMYLGLAEKINGRKKLNDRRNSNAFVVSSAGNFKIGSSVGDVVLPLEAEHRRRLEQILRYMAKLLQQKDDASASLVRPATADNGQRRLQRNARPTSFFSQAPALCQVSFSRRARVSFYQGKSSPVLSTFNRTSVNNHEIKPCWFRITRSVLVTISPPVPQQHPGRPALAQHLVWPETRSVSTLDGLGRRQVNRQGGGTPRAALWQYYQHY
jgi:hypothetical protein